MEAQGSPTQNRPTEQGAGATNGPSAGIARRASAYNLRSTPARQANRSPASSTASVLGRRTRQEAFPEPPPPAAEQLDTRIDARNRLLQHLMSREAGDTAQPDQPTVHFSFQYMEPDSTAEPTTVMVNVHMQGQQRNEQEAGEDQRPTFMFNIYYLQPTPPPETLLLMHECRHPLWSTSTRTDC